MVDINWDVLSKMIEEYEQTHPSIDIENKCQRQIKCISNNDNTWGGDDNASKFLIMNEIYTLDHFEVHNWHTRVFLKEFPGSWFNSVAFCEI